MFVFQEKRGSMFPKFNKNINIKEAVDEQGK